MRKDIHNKIENYTREKLSSLNKSELARRFNCDPRTIDRYLKVSSGEPMQKKSSRAYKSITNEKVDTYGATAMSACKFIQKNSIYYIINYVTM